MTGDGYRGMLRVDRSEEGDWQHTRECHAKVPNALRAHASEAQLALVGLGEANAPRVSGQAPRKPREGRGQRQQLQRRWVEVGLDDGRDMDDFVRTRIEEALDDTNQCDVAFLRHHQLVEVSLSVGLFVSLSSQAFDLINERLHEPARIIDGWRSRREGHGGSKNSPKCVRKNDDEENQLANSFLLPFVLMLWVLVVSENEDWVTSHLAFNSKTHKVIERITDTAAGMMMKQSVMRKKMISPRL